MGLQRNLGTGYAHIFNKRELFELLNEIREKVVEENLSPVLHFEAHGCPAGLELESGEVVLWNELCDYLRSINVAMNNTLLIVLAACYGLEIGAEIMPLFHPPFRCVVAPIEKASFSKVEERFDAFYEVLPNSLANAICALNNHRDDNGFAYVNITIMFNKAWEFLKEEHDSIAKLYQLADYLFEIKIFKSGTGIEEARASLVGTFLGAEKTKWAVYRRFMMAESLPDEGEDVLHYAHPE